VVAVTQKKVPVSSWVPHARTVHLLVPDPLVPGNARRPQHDCHIARALISLSHCTQDKLIDPTSITHLFKVGACACM